MTRGFKSLRADHYDMKKSIVLLLLSACGMPQGSTHKEFIPYIKTFTEITGLAVNVTMSFTEDRNFVGVCKIYSTGERKVEVNSAYWATSDENTREQIILHELGHCVLNRDHTETMAEHPDYWFEFPNSVMYPYVFGRQRFYEQFKQHYFEELIDPEKPFVE